MLLRLSLLLFFIGSLNLQAQHPFAWELTEEDGLPSEEVYDLYQDKKGYMWIATNKGLCKYNGVEFVYFQNQHQKGSSLSGIQEDKEGKIWVRNFKNQLFYVKNDSLYYFEAMESVKIAALIDFLIDTRGTVHILAKGVDSTGILKYDSVKNTFQKHFLFKNISNTNYQTAIYDLKETEQQEIILTTGSGLYLKKEKGFEFISAAHLQEHQNFKHHILPFYLFPISKGKSIILQSFKEHYHLYEFDYQTIKPITNWKHKAHFEEKRPHSLRVLEDGSIWQLSLSGGVGMIFNEQKPTDLADINVLFPNEGVTDIVLDHEGNYWVSSLTNGIYIIPHLSLQQYNSTNSIFKQDVFGVLAKSQNKNLLLSDDKGKVLRYDPNNKKIVGYYQTPPHICTNITVAQDKLVITGQSYNNIYTKENSQAISINNQQPISLKNTSIYKDTLFIQAEGATGISIANVHPYIQFTSPIDSHLFSYIPSYFSIQSPPGTSLKYNSYDKAITRGRSNWVLSDDNNDRFWVAWADSLFYYPEKGHPASVSFEGKPIQAVHLAQSEDGMIWASTEQQGILGINKNLEVTQSVQLKDGLLQKTVLKIFPEGSNLWFLTTKGIQSWNTQTDAFHNYTIQDGLPTNEIKDIAVLNNKVWLSTSRGLVSFDKNIPSKNNSSPFVFIKSISIHEKDTLLNDHYHLNYNQNALSIFLDGIAFRSRGNFSFQYRMIGLDSIWRSQPSNNKSIRFPQLSPNNYIFEARVVNEDGIASKVATVRFDIAPPYWQTWWFQGSLYLIGIVLVVGVVLLVVRSRQREERQQNQFNVLRMQALQSQMNPHFIFNVLTAVQNLWLQQKNEAALDMQSNFAKLLRKIFSHSSKLAISIEEIEDFLNNYLHLEQIRFEQQVDIDFQIEEDLLDDDYYIPPLLIQPIIENSFKHGLLHQKGPKKLNIQLKKEGAYLYCIIEDNGVGRNPTAPKLPNRTSGLSTTQERLSILQNSIIKKPHPSQNFRITDLFDEQKTPSGTKVELWIPFVKI